MIVSASIRRFRGFESFDINGFGRVNLIIGRNDTGKTALMEALFIAESPSPAHTIHMLEKRRLAHVLSNDFEGFWAPLFWRGATDSGLELQTQAASGTRHSVRLRATEAPVVVSTDSADAMGAPSWTVELTTGIGAAAKPLKISAEAGTLKFPRSPDPSISGVWITPESRVGPWDIRMFSDLKREGRDSALVELISKLDGRISEVEILAPTGREAELFVRLQGDPVPLPIGVMGDGFQRCFSIGVALLAEGALRAIDEVENGIHHSALEPMWRWMAIASRDKNTQIFATTHSEECIEAACRAFTALNDDGLRIIRLDRRGDAMSSVIYDRDLIATAVEAGMEIRG